MELPTTEKVCACCGRRLQQTAYVAAGHPTICHRCHGWQPYGQLPYKRIGVAAPSTRVECLECGHSFARTLGKYTHSVRCPRCHSYDVQPDV